METKHPSKRHIVDEFIDDLITLDNFKFILDNFNEGTSGSFKLDDNPKRLTLIDKLFSFFNREPRLFEMAQYDKSLTAEEFELTHLENITFYNTLSSNKDLDGYCIICIDRKLALYRSTMDKDCVVTYKLVKDKQTISSMKKSFKVLLDKVKEYKIKHDTENSQKKDLASLCKVKLQKSIKVFEELGYINSKNTDTNALIEEVINDDLLYEDDIEKLTQQNFNEFIYLKLSHQDNNGNYYTDKSILCDYEFLDPSEEYISFMERFGQITNGELRFSNISLRVDNDGYENLDFTVNDMNKSWRLEKEGNILSECFSYFAPLTKEFNTTRNYTCYSTGQAFVVDYATEEEQELFIKKTRLKRKWLE